MSNYYNELKSKNDIVIVAKNLGSTEQNPADPIRADAQDIPAAAVNAW